MRLKAGQVCLVRLPRTDLAEGKYRPVLLLTRLPGPFGDWLVCAITSQLRHAVANWDEEIAEADDDFESSGLKGHSLIRIGKLATVEEEALEGVLGEISSRRIAAIRSKIADCIERQAVGRDNG
ncbi:MAG: type II toxin-antitoxin system PemK/MazF family toxin [Candidatus Bipolaricaulota bacterium]